jgi:hypothetical protein
MLIHTILWSYYDHIIIITISYHDHIMTIPWLYHIITISYHIIWYHIISWPYHIMTISYHIISYHIISCHIMTVSYYVISWQYHVPWFQSRSVQVLETVGFGDIVGRNTEETIFSIFYLYLSGNFNSDPYSAPDSNPNPNPNIYIFQGSYIRWPLLTCCFWLIIWIRCASLGVYHIISYFIILFDDHDYISSYQSKSRPYLCHSHIMSIMTIP